MKLINKLTPEHLEKLQNLEYAHAKEKIVQELQKEYVFEMTIGGGFSFCNYILNKPLDYITIHDYFNPEKI